MLCYRFHRHFALGTLFLLFISTGCDTPETVAQFCSSAVTTISSATNVLADLEPSCLREVNYNTYVLGSFTRPASSDSKCTEIATQGAASVAAAKLLSEYFSALNSLATAGVSTPSKDASNLASQAAAISGATAEQKSAISSLAADLTKGIMTAYQFHALARDLPRTKTNVDNIVAALINVIHTNYLNELLNDEEEKQANPYRDFKQQQELKKNVLTPEAILALDRTWRANEETLQARRRSAQSAITALQTLQKGFDQLADNADKIKPKDVPGLLSPYVIELQTLIPQIQKAF